MRGVCLNTATKKELLEVTALTEADVNVILRMRGDNGQLERSTLFGEITLTEQQLQELVSKGVVQVIFLEDLSGLADDGSSVAVTQEKEGDSDLRDILLALKNGQEKIWKAVETGNDNQKEMSRRVKEVETRQGVLVQQQRKMQDDQMQQLGDLTERILRLEIQQQRKVKDDGGRSAKQSDDLGGGVKGQLSQPHASTPTSELAEGSFALDNDPIMPTAEARKVLPSVARPFSETWYYNPARRTLESVQEQGGEEELMHTRAIKRETEINHPGQSVYAGWKARKRLKTSQASMKSSGKGNASKYSLNDSHLTSSDSDSDDSEPEVFHRKHRTPSLPKMQTFDGKSSEWGPFIFQFRKLAKAGHWTEKEKRDGLLACLRGKAIT